MIENFWGVDDFTQANTEETASIYTIMTTQCQFLRKLTHDMVFAVFGEIKQDVPLAATLTQMLDSIKSPNLPNLKTESVGEEKTGSLTDASNMFYETEYAFEIFTNTYKFRLFKIIMTPSYPIDIFIDDGILNSIYNELNKFEKNKNKPNSYKIYSEDEFCHIIKLIFHDRKVRYIIKKLEQIALEEQKCIYRKRNRSCTDLEPHSNGYKTAPLPLS